MMNNTTLNNNYQHLSSSNNIGNESDEHILFGALMTDDQSTDYFNHNSLVGASVYTYDADRDYDDDLFTDE